MVSSTLLALSFLPLSLAHFNLNYPETRGFVEENESTFPCGGYNDVSQNRTNFPMSGGPIQLVMGHPQTHVAVYMAIGDNPGSGFSIVAKPQLMVQGLGDFCMSSVAVPSGLNVTSGTKATIQVVTNGDGEGGLYQCADVTLVNTPLFQSDFNNNCKNNTGIKVVQENISGNPNSTSSGTNQTSSSGSAASPKSTSKTSGAATQAQAVSWVLGAAGLAGLAML